MPVVYRVWKDGKPYIGCTSRTLRDRWYERDDSWPQDYDRLEEVAQFSDLKDAQALEKMMIQEAWPEVWNKSMPGIPSQKFREIHSARMKEYWATGNFTSLSQESKPSED